MHEAAGTSLPAIDGRTEVDIKLTTPEEQPREASALISLNLVSGTPMVPTLPVVASSEPVIAKPVELPEPVIAVAPKSEVVKEKPVEKVPAQPVVVAAPAAKVASPKPKVVEQNSVSISPQQSAVVVTQPQYADGDEEITLVRPPRRLKIDLEKPRTIYRTQTAYARSAADISFQPTMIEPRKEKRWRPAPTPEVQDGMFSAHFGSSSEVTNVKYRAMAIGVGCIVLATLFLFANDAVSRFFQNVSPGDSATAKATSSEIAVDASPSAEPVFKPTRASLRTSSETPATETKPTKIVDESKPASKTSSDREKPKETPKAGLKSTHEKPIQKRAEREPPKKQPVTRPAFPDLGRPSGATRARIVKDPRP
jgi:hypothetical protein